MYPKLEVWFELIDFNKDYVERLYNSTKYNKDYQKLVQSDTKIIGIWDDHDYGMNDVGGNFPYKNITREVFLDFLDEPKNSIRRT